MAKVIQLGDQDKLWFRKTCRHCATVFEFEEKDLWVHAWPGDFFSHRTLYVSCPGCGDQILATDVPEDMYWRARANAPVLKQGR